MIGDDIPHVVSYTDQRTNWHDELDVLKGLGVKVRFCYCSMALYEICCNIYAKISSLDSCPKWHFFVNRHFGYKMTVAQKYCGLKPCNSDGQKIV